LEDQRSIADFFHILDNLINVNTGDYILQQVNEECHPLNSPVVQLSPGKIKAGRYIIGKFPSAIHVS
jgi:hypothetical protein